MSNALAQLKAREFICPEALEISAHVLSILDASPPTEEQEPYVSYAASVPFYVESLWSNAVDQDRLVLILPILASIRDYFFEADDLVPDHHGALGLLDDAYMAYCFIGRLNDRWRESTGTPLVEMDLSYQTAMMAGHLGAEIAGELRRRVDDGFEAKMAAMPPQLTGMHLLGGLAAMYAVGKLMSGGGSSDSDRWVSLFNNSVDHGW